MNAAALIRKHGKPITLVRPTAGTYVDGRPVPGVPFTFEVVASVQPLSPRERAKLAEGDHTRERVRAYCAEALSPSSERWATKGDTFTWGGRVYEVEGVEPWESGLQLGNHWKAIAALKDGQG